MRVLRHNRWGKWLEIAEGAPSDSETGWAPGAIYIQADGTGGANIYINMGDASSTTWALLPDGQTLADAGSLVAATTIEDAIQELAQHQQSAQAFLNLPMGAWTEQSGTALADFADGASTTPGWSAGDEGFGIRWNNHANPDPISASVPVPPDLDAAADVIVHYLAAKTGATVGDAVTWTTEIFFNVDAALYDADADAGGASSAMTGDATAKTCQEETLTIAATNVCGSPAVMTITVQPTDGKLGTDDVILLGVWLEYTRKTLTS